MSLGSDMVARRKFREYLVNRCGLKNTTANVYANVVNILSECLKESNMLNCSLYDIKNIHKLLDIKTKLAKTELFRDVNNYTHGNLTPGLRHYYNFVVSSNDSDHRKYRNTEVSFL